MEVHEAIALFGPRFFAKVRYEDGCWIWKGSKSGGSNRPNVSSYFDGVKRTHLASRVAYIATFGQPPDGLELDHLCRREDCVSPYCLEPVTHRENSLRGKRVTCRHDEALRWVSPDGKRSRCRVCEAKRLGTHNA